MAEFELMRYVTIGQYLPTGSFLHRLDPRFKLLAFGAMVVGVAFTGSYTGSIVGLLGAVGLVIPAVIPILTSALSP